MTLYFDIKYQSSFICTVQALDLEILRGFDTLIFRGLDRFWSELSKLRDGMVWIIFVVSVAPNSHTHACTAHDILNPETANAVFYCSFITGVHSCHSSITFYGLFNRPGLAHRRAITCLPCHQGQSLSIDYIIYYYY